MERWLPGAVDGRERQAQPEHGAGTPDDIPRGVIHLGIQARTRGVEAYLRKPLGNSQFLAVIELGGGKQGVDLNLQLLAGGGQRALPKSPVQGQSGESQEGREHDARGNQEPGIKRESARSVQG